MLGFLGGLLIAFIGAVLALVSIGDGLARWSYDLPFLWRSSVTVTNAAIVYVDARAESALGGASAEQLRPALAQLLDRLTADGAAAVALDLLCARPTDPAVDQALADAVRRHGRAIVGALEDKSPHDTGQATVAIKQLRLPIVPLEQSAARIGLIQLHDDLVQRRLYTGSADFESMGWATARVAREIPGAPDDSRFRERWLNYRGPAFTIPSVSLAEALQPDGVPPGFFRGRTVFVGGHPMTFPKEGFHTPYTTLPRFDGARFARQQMSGVELHATIWSNLTAHDWIERIASDVQAKIIALFGAIAGWGLALIRPWRATALALSTAGLLATGSAVLQWERQITWAWLIPAAVQLPLAIAWSLGCQHAVEGRRRRRIQQAFGAYLSPHLARRIAENEFDLSPGGTEVEATIMFTDLEGFSALAEHRSPAEVSRLLIAYFSETTRHIWDHDGTIIKYVGDSVMATWGAPLPDADAAAHAALAACGIQSTAHREFLGLRLHTRIGISSGRVLAGNLGSPVRFDYTAIGATTNLAARLEALNKRLGTRILAAEATRRALGDRFIIRPLGRFQLPGFGEPQAVFEIIGPAPSRAANVGSEDPAGTSNCPDLDWLALFAEGLAALERLDWPRADRLFRQVQECRGGNDGPSAFCLEFIGRRTAVPNPIVPPPPGWDGIFRA